MNVIDIDLNASYAINKTTTRYTINTSTEVRSFKFGMNGKNYFFKDWTLGYDLTKTINSGYISTRNSNPAILNIFVERRFLKNNKGTIRLQGYDLFNQNTGISREVNGTIVTDYQNNRLGKYFLLSFNLRLQKFKGRNMQRTPGERNGNGGGQRNGSGGGNRGGNGGGGRRSN